MGHELVAVTKSVTLNIGDYESVKPTVSRSVAQDTPDDPDDAQQLINEAYDRLSDEVHRLWLIQAYWELNLALDRRKITKQDIYMVEKQLDAIEAEARDAGVDLS